MAGKSVSSYGNSTSRSIWEIRLSLPAFTVLVSLSLGDDLCHHDTSPSLWLASGAGRVFPAGDFFLGSFYPPAFPFHGWCLPLPE